MTPEDAATFHIRVFGRVQGVGYRGWTVQKARQFGLVGWVRNLTDGTVEAVAHGPREALETLVASCQAGPPSARVIEVTSRETTSGSFTSFQQLPTAAPE